MEKFVFTLLITLHLLVCFNLASLSGSRIVLVLFPNTWDSGLSNYSVLPTLFSPFTASFLTFKDFSLLEKISLFIPNIFVRIKSISSGFKIFLRLSTTAEFFPIESFLDFFSLSNFFVRVSLLDLSSSSSSSSSSFGLQED